MKRTLTLILSVVIIAVAFNVGGCGKTDSASQGGTSFFPTVTLD
jgi:hypothetical protein